MFKVSDAGAEKAQVSPEGKFVAYRIFDQHIRRPQIVVLTLEGGAPVKTLDLPAPTLDTMIRWAADSRGLVYTHTQGGAGNLWRLPLDGGRPVQLTNFTSDNIRAFAYSRDGRQLALSRGNTTRDAVLISDEK